MPEIMLERPQAQHAHELGRICFEAFKDISEKHGFLSDFHSLDFAQSVISSSIANESNFSVAAIVDGRPAPLSTRPGRPWVVSPASLAPTEV